MLRCWTFAMLARKWRHDKILYQQIPTNDYSLIKASLLMVSSFCANRFPSANAA